MTDEAELARVSLLYSKAKNSIEKSLEFYQLESDIRIWPHHFDIGAFAKVTDNLSIGFGLAIPDKNIEDFYYYSTAYNSEGSLDTNNLEELSIGQWQKGSWDAATIEASNLNLNQSGEFLIEAIKVYKNEYE